ncbi:MAG: MMPL family transporter [Pseudomonadota bacterium]
MRREALVATLLWVALAAAALLIVASARYTTDLSAFLPRTPTAAQRLLVDQLRDGVASRLIIVAIEGGDATTRSTLARALAAVLRTEPRFTSINNGESISLQRDREILFDNRYVLSAAVSPQRFTAAGLGAAIKDTLDQLASPAGLLAKPLLLRDPTGEFLQVLEQVTGGAQPRTVEGVWASGDGERALLLARTRAAGSDTDAQQDAIAAIRAAFAGALGQLPAPVTPAATLKLTGPGVFAVNARATIENEARLLAATSAVLIVALLFTVYRSATAVLLGLVPVVSGALAGVAAVALGFGVVHGITLGFGITLIGEAVDYSIYLFIQKQRGGLWKTISLGVLTSICGFASLVPSAFPGLAQLGVYSITGLIVAALVTRFVLPHWLPAGFAVRDLAPLGNGVALLLRRLVVLRPALVILPVLAVLVIWLHRDTLWNRELSALSPVSEADLQQDGRLRADLGAPDVRYLVVVSGPDREAVLRAAERAAAPLQRLVEVGVIEGFESASTYLPSLLAQRERQQSLPDAGQLRAQLQTAVADLPLKASRLDAFIDDVAAARQRPLLTAEALQGSSLAAGVDALLLHTGGDWTALLPLRAPSSGEGAYEIDIARVRAAVATVDNAVVLDLKQEADGLYSTYLSEIVRLSLAGLAAIVLLLFLVLRSPLRVARVVTPLVLAVLAVLAGHVLFGPPMTILHLIGLLLIVAVGSNYALFFDRRALDVHSGAEPLTLASLVVANATTVMAFGVLALSSVPVLSALGSTVAPGALLALLFAAVLARQPAAAGVRA